MSEEIGITTLETLRDALINGDGCVTDRRTGDWRTDLPTYGGPEPADTQGVWSWDKHRLLVGTCGDDLEIVDRDGLLVTAEDDNT
jgi:hypothetical protein